MQAIVLVGGGRDPAAPADRVRAEAGADARRPTLPRLHGRVAGRPRRRGGGPGLRVPARRPARSPWRGERAGAAIRYVAEPEPLGTGGAIRFAAEALGDRLGDRFLALNGDVLTDLDLTALLKAHEEAGATATLGLHPVEDSAAYGLVHRGEDGVVSAFLEKTGETSPGEVNAGMYVLQRAVLDSIPAGRNVSIEHDVFPRLVGRGLHGLALDGYWMDIGTPERYLQASWDILEGAVETRVEPGPDATFTDPGAEVAGDAAVGPRAVPRAGLQRRVAGDGPGVRRPLGLPDRRGRHRAGLDPRGRGRGGGRRDPRGRCDRRR